MTYDQSTVLKESKQKKKKKGRNLSPVDIRFLKAVDLLLEKNKQQGKLPTNYSALSELLSSDRNTISKIRSGVRHVSFPQLVKFATLFTLDYNYFFRDHVVDIFYKISAPPIPQNVATKKGVQNSGSKATTIQVENGNVYHSSENLSLDEDESQIQDEDRSRSKEEVQRSIESEEAKQIILLQQELLREKEEKMVLMKKYMEALEKRKK